MVWSLSERKWTMGFVFSEDGVAMGRRSMFVVVGDKAKDRVIEGRMVAVAGVSASVIQKGHKFDNR